MKLAGPDVVEEVVWYVWGEAPKVFEKLGQLAVAHLLEHRR
jgi:hypothetical protein